VADISEQRYYRWRKEYGGLRLEQAKRLKDLEKENQRPKKLVTELSLDKAMRRGSEGRLLSPERRRQAVSMLQDNFNVSERRACQLLGLPRGTQRYLPTQAADEDELTQAIVALASE